MVDRGGFLESVNAIPEPHQFAATLRIGAAAAQCDFVEHGHAKDSSIATTTFAPPSSM